jgi:hypothetical protein
MPKPADGTCPALESCPMFEVFTLSGTLAVWQDNYCRSDYGRCARYQRFRVGAEVPRNLMPNGKVLTSLPK